MFNRFTDTARRVVVIAQQMARERQADRIGTEHVLLALCDVPDTITCTVLDEHAVTAADVAKDIDALAPLGRSDAESLATVGIDLDEVRRSVEQTFGRGALDRTRSTRGRRYSGHIPFERATKRVLELALREALQLKHNHIGTEHILLGLLRGEGSAQRVLLARGVQLNSARRMVDDLARGRRAG